jgi:hypothetical protein
MVENLVQESNRNDYYVEEKVVMSIGVFREKRYVKTPLDKTAKI